MTERNFRQSLRDAIEAREGKRGELWALTRQISGDVHMALSSINQALYGGNENIKVDLDTEDPSLGAEWRLGETHPLLTVRLLLERGEIKVSVRAGVETFSEPDDEDEPSTKSIAVNDRETALAALDRLLLEALGLLTYVK